MPPDLTPKFQQVAQHINQRKFEQGRQVLMKVLQLAPGHPDACNGMAICLEGLGQLEQAVYYAQKSVAGRPTDGGNLNTLASLLIKLERYDEGIATLRRAIEVEPNLQMLRDNLVNALWNAGRCSESARLLREMLAHKPGDPSISQRLATKLTLLARAPEGVALCRTALPQGEVDEDLTRALATSLLNDPGASVREVVEGHMLAGRALVASAGGRVHARSLFTNPRELERPLRIGFVSPDFRQHSVSFFVESLLERLDRAAFQVVLYSNGGRDDAVTARLKRLASDFVTITGMDDAHAGGRIVKDRIDILIDLAGHSNGTRLGLFAMRAAPVQATYCGYPATTGLAMVDYRPVDSLTDPAGSESHCAEKLLRLDPVFLCYRPPQDAPGIERRAGDAGVTFGSFNATSKLNDRVIALWSRVLRAVEGSNLLLKAYTLADPEFRADLMIRFEAQGVARGRVECVPATNGLKEHLATYGRVDIGLDPFPYHGTTTTCEAAYMGVPTVTLLGEMHHSRVGASLLTSLGLEDLIATSADEYVDHCTRLAADAGRRATLRGADENGLRARLLASPLCDADAFAKRFAAGLRTMWKECCASGV